VNVRILIDGIVRQTTVLIAQLSTAAGVRAPLAHVADQVFLDLSREIESQGVSRKVAADMFGMALRSYQKKTQRLAESETDRSRTLWEAVIDFLRDGSKTRQRILERFRGDGEKEVVGVLSDLLSSGLVYSTGRGDSALHGLSSEADRHVIAAERDLRSLANVVWLEVFLGNARTAAELAQLLGVATAQADRAVAVLLEEGRLERTADQALRASNVFIPVGAPEGWEAAILDHFRAVATAIGRKAQAGGGASTGDDVGGSTLSFTIHGEHPHAAAVKALFSSTRQEAFALWDKVAAYNSAHPPPAGSTRVTFYVGQMLTEVDDTPVG